MSRFGFAALLPFSFALALTGCLNEERDCEPGATRDADDGCNTCICGDDGNWACTLLGCPDAGGDVGDAGGDAACVEGSTRPAGDGCNSCSCVDGGWLCTMMPCPEPECADGDTQPAPDGCNTCTCHDGAWACTQMGCVEPGACVTADDCMVTGCSGQICAATDVATDCAWLDEYACYADPEITSCGCFDGVCGWAQTDALAECLGAEACTEGDMRPAGDECNTCTCMADGTWACTLRACLDCTPGETQPAGDGCNSCTCTDSGEWACTLMECSLCTPGNEAPSPDGCNMCICTDERTWACTEMACTECIPGEMQPADDGCNTCTCTADGTWACTEMACGGTECNDDTDCMATGCSSQLCAAEPIATTCEWFEWYGCYHDAALTSCGCIEGVCGWTQSDALAACISGAR